MVKDQKDDLIEKVINWSLSVGRALVIITELIALSAFLLRFGLDQQLIDLHTQIKQSQAIVSAFKNNEDEYRNLQERLSIASNFSLIGEKRIQIYRAILALASPGITFNKISLTAESITIEIRVSSVTALSDFINTLKSSTLIASVSIDKIETKTTNGVIIVGISANLKHIPDQYAIEIK